MPDIGELGEQLVAGWLQTQGWAILHHRWRCRWGEIDLIAQRNPSQQEVLDPKQPTRSCLESLLAFVEVKTRSRGNWDADGLLAITPPKQAKLWQTAQLFLAEYPDLTNLPCRFDVALVSYRRVSQDSRRTAIGKDEQVPQIQLGQPVLVAGYQLTLQDYIQSAFD
jgi:putative endonuclease